MIRLVAVLLLSANSMGTWCAAAMVGTLYAGGIGSRDLYSIDPATGVRAVIPHFSNYKFTGFTGFNGLAFNSRDGRLYGTAANAERIPPLPSPVGLDFYRIDPNTFVMETEKLAGLTLELGQSIDGLEYDPRRDVFWATIPARHQLIKIDPYSFVGTVVGQLPDSSLISGLAYDSASDTLFGVDDNAGGAGQSQLVSINLDTFQLTGVGPIGLGLGLNDVDSLAFDRQTRSIYAINDLASGFATRQLLGRIDPSTGLATAVGTPALTVESYQGLALIVPEPNSGSTTFAAMLCIALFIWRDQVCAPR